MNLDQPWTYVEPDDVCIQCNEPWAEKCSCPDRRIASGGPGHYVTMTEREILRQYYEYWRAGMVRIGKLDDITPENCIQDWVVVHWAWKGEANDAQRTA